jgi:hypothetical protein
MKDPENSSAPTNPKHILVKIEKVGDTPFCAPRTVRASYVKAKNMPQKKRFLSFFMAYLAKKTKNNYAIR